MVFTREEEVDGGFDDDGGDQKADVGFEVDVPDEIDDGRKENGSGDNGIVEGFDAAGMEGVGAGSSADFAEVEAEGDFGDDTDDEDDDGGDGDVEFLGFEETRDGFDDDVGGDQENDDADDLGTETLDVGVGEFFARFQGMGLDFFADHNDQARESVDQAVQSVGEDGEGAGDEADDKFESEEQEVDGDGEKTSAEDGSAMSVGFRARATRVVFRGSMHVFRMIFGLLGHEILIGHWFNFSINVL